MLALPGPTVAWRSQSKTQSCLASKIYLIKGCSLGDSGYIHIRSNAVRYASSPQTHDFNTPYQLSVIPPKMQVQSRIFGSGPLQDFPRDANVTHRHAKHGDVFVFATDGVWDNTSAQEILGTVSRCMTEKAGWVTSVLGMIGSKKLKNRTGVGGLKGQPDHSLQSLLAVRITSEAKAASKNRRRDGPFAKEVQRRYPQENYHGGKADDICVLVVIAVEKSAASPISPSS